MAQTVPPGFIVTTYVANAPATGGVTGMAMDTDTRTIYYGEANTIGALRKIAPDRTVTIVATNMVAVTEDASFYPFVATDLEYYRGGVYYIASAPGNIERVDTTTGAIRVIAQLSGSENECGLVIRDGVLYATDGTGTANALRVLVLPSQQAQTFASNLPPTSSSLDYNAVKDRYYFTDQGGARVMQVTPAGVVSQLGTGTNSAYNLAVEPNGAAAYVISGATVLRYDTSTGAATTFLSGLTGVGTYPDLVFGPSSSGSGVSLYIGDGNRILEVAGFKPANQPPTITAPDSITTDEDRVAIFTIDSSDPDGDSVFQVVNPLTKGVLTPLGGTQWTFTPNANANGADSFMITASDGKGGTTNKTVNVTINPINDAPSFVDVPVTLPGSEDMPIGFSFRTNDIEGDPVIVSFSGAAKGAVSAGASGYIYTPKLDANGADSFKITATDGNGGTTEITVDVILAPVNDVPVFTAVPVTLITDEDLPVRFNVAASDVDEDAVNITGTNGQKGTVSVSGDSFTYTPGPNANGEDSFTVVASDGSGGTTRATVHVMLNPINDAPVFTSLPGMLVINEDAAVEFSIATADVEGDLVTIGVSGAAKGAVSGTAGNYTYTPTPDANGVDSLTITASDGNGGTTGGTIEITIAPVNDAPVFTSIPATMTTNRDAPVSFNLTTSDMEGDAVTISFSGAAKGAVSRATGNYTYTPNAGERGIDRFTVSADDGHGGITTATVKVTIVAYPARYALLLGDASGVHASLSVSLSSAGSLSGILRDEENRTVRFRGKFAPDASSAAIQLKGGTSLALEFDTRSRITATLTAAERILIGAGNVAIIPAEGLRGRYTMALDTNSGGFGWCVPIMDARGNIRILGKLPDGSSISAGQISPIDGDNNAQVFLLGARRARVLLSGSLHFAAEAQSDATGVLKFRKSGIDAKCDAIGALFSKATSALPPGSYPIVFEGNGVNLSSSVTFSSNNTATVLDPVITLAPGGGVRRSANGLFTAEFRPAADVVGQRPDATISGSGVFIQKLGKGFGQFLVDGATGEIRIGE